MIARFRVGTPQRTLAFFAILASFALFSWTDLTASPSPSPTDLRASSSADDAEKLRLTVEATRTAGVAIYRRAVDFWGEGQVDAWHEQRRAQANGDETSSIDWSACSPIRYEELRELLVPAFIDELPAMDGWNHPLEFCLVEAADPSRAHLMGVRSPGRDGAFSGDLYPVGAFPRNDIDRDVVWMDGFYYTWPQQE